MTAPLGFTLGGVHSSTHNVICTTVRNLKPKQIPREITVPGMHGTYDFGNPTFDKRTFLMNCTVICSSMANMRSRGHEIAAWAAAATALEFDDDPGIVWIGRAYDDIEQSSEAFIGDFKLVFTAQPIGTGAAFTHSCAAEFNVTGNQSVLPTITIETLAGYSSGSLKAAVSSSGEYIQIDTALSVGDIIVMNVNTRKVTRNGATIMGNVNISSFITELPIGSQSINLTPALSVSGTVSYNARYI